MNDATAVVEYEQILVVGDLVPSGGAWGQARRSLQLMADIRVLRPEARLVHAATEVEARAIRPSWADTLRVELVGRQLDWRAWLDDHRFSFSLILLTEDASAHRLIEDIRRSQPQATIIGLLPWLAPISVGAETRFSVREEQKGSLFFHQQLRARDAALLAGLDGMLCGSDNDLALGTEMAGRVTLYHYPTGGGADSVRPSFASRDGLLSWGRFASEPGDPDEEAAVLVDSSLRPLLQSFCPEVVLRVALENAPLGLKQIEAPASALADELRRAKVLVVARTFGVPANTDSLVLASAEAGAPVVALEGSMADPEGCIIAADVPDLARRTAHLASDTAAWDDARTRLDEWWLRRATSERLGGLAAMLSHAGLASSPSTSPVALPVQREERTAGMRTFQAQVQTPGFVQHRPMSLPFARADLTQDQLWPAVAYGAWYDSHPITEPVLRDMRERAGIFPLRPLISLVMPIYNTDPAILDEAFESVLAQAYPFWEICAVDDGSSEAGTVEKLADLAARDARIHVARLEVNQGIVAASNAALAMTHGEFIALLDHDDLLSPDALYEVVALLNEEPEIDYLYSDEDKINLEGKRADPFFKPSWSPHLHLCVNYVTHFAVYRRTVLDSIGGFRPGYDGSQDYDLALRATEVARRVGHIAKPIYTWRMVPGSAAAAHDAKPYALEAARRALNDALARRGFEGTVEEGLVPGTWRPRFAVKGDPLVSILIPTRNGRRLLERCLESIVEKTTYRNFEFVIVDNGSDDQDTLDYLRSLKATVVRYPYQFNFARQMNLAVTAAKGDQVLFLNNDMEIVTPGWLEAMVELAQQETVGAVGARLLFPNGRVQHEGVFVGFGGGSAGNVDFGDYFGLGRMIRDASAVTAACMLMRVEPFHRVGGFDERLRVAFNDVDLCLRLRQQGYHVVYTPYAELVHLESASRGKLHPDEDEAFFGRRWGAPGTFRDPFYNPNLDPIRPFRLRR